ncbi:hypothetical protein ACFQ1L_33380 [Phytohabitans flavus]|uniref:hypothetical protein n=1 Tax=Phytohabitans flavus TaxID=1076124 RepID=UPI0031F13AA8
MRLDGGLLQLIENGILLRSLPNPLTPAEQARIRDARPAGPPTPAPEPIRGQRRISSRGSLTVARQRIHAGMMHAGRTITVGPLTTRSASTTATNYSPTSHAPPPCRSPDSRSATRTTTPAL